MQDKFSFIDLFCGIGGIRQGFESIGGDCVFSSDIDKHARQVYFDNYNEYPSGDITEIDESSIPTFDVLCAGFPCQPFSQAGLGKGFDDDRGNLFFDITRIIKHHKPKVVFLENVKRLRTHDKGNTFATITKHLKDLGYSVNHKVLNARDFGVPQNRERIYIVALLDDSLIYKFPDAPNTEQVVGDILETNVDPKYTISDKLWAGHQRRKVQNKLNGKGFGYSSVTPDSPYTRAITARYYKDGSEILIEQEGANPRKVTPREASRLQGFPDSFKITCSDCQAYKQFGNSVAVNVIKELALSIKESGVFNTK